MDDLIGSIAEKAGISETQAKMAAGAIFDRVDDKLPAPIAAQVKKALGLDAGGMLGSVVGDVANGEGGGMLDAVKGQGAGLMDAAKGEGDGLLDAAKGLLG